MDGTLGLLLTMPDNEEWLMTCIAVQCPHCESEQSAVPALA